MTEPRLDTLLLEVRPDGVALLTFNRPDVRNALSEAVVADVHAALAYLAGRDDLRALVLTGAGGKAFVSGADIAELRERTRRDALRRINTGLFRQVEQCPVPTVAAIRGYALGGGLELAAACDLRVCGQGARLGQPEVSLGIIPGAGATYRLPRLVGLGRAKDLVLTARVVGAAEALAIGLVDRVVPDDEVVTAALALAAEVAAHAPLAVRLAKVALNASAEGSTDALQALEVAVQAVLFEDEDKRARMTAFLEKRGRGGATPRPAGPALKVHGLLVHGSPSSGAGAGGASGAGGAEVRLTAEDLAQLPGQVPDVSARAPGRSGRAVALASVLDRAGPRAEARHVGVASRDGRFSTSLALEDVGPALLLYADASGAALADADGGPFRLLIPGYHDPCANVKQVGTIELRAEPGPNACAHGSHAPPGQAPKP